MLMSMITRADIVNKVYVDGLYYNLNTEEKTAEVTFKKDEKYTDNIVIPKEIQYNNEYYTVTRIDDSAFKSDGNIALRSVSIPETVTSIGDRAFWGCHLLGSIIIPSSVTSIGDYAFDGCAMLKTIFIGKGVTSIGKYVFSESNYIESIMVDKDNTVYDSRNNCNAIIETATNKLITGCQSTTIPYGVVSIGDGAFWGCYKLTSIEIPNSVITIGEKAFLYSGLSSLILSSNLEKIGNRAFDGCRSLRTVTCYATEPPRIGETPFDGSLSSYRTLYVPESYVGNYQTSSFGSYFKNILPIVEPISTSINDSYKRANNSCIYTLSGQEVSNPQSGIYIRNGKKYIKR